MAQTMYAYVNKLIKKKNKVSVLPDSSAYTFLKEDLYLIEYIMHKIEYRKPNLIFSASWICSNNIPKPLDICVFTS
jgi:hypothetical protein